MVWGISEQRNTETGIQTTWWGAATPQAAALGELPVQKGVVPDQQSWGLGKHMLSSCSPNWIEISPKINYVIYFQQTIPHCPVLHIDTVHSNI